VRRSALGLAVLLTALPASVHAQDQPTLAPDAQVQITTTAPEGKTGETDTTLPAPPPEAPPPRPRHKGVVLESTGGVLGFAGQFRHVAPPAFWMHLQLGYEITNWLMAFGEGELAFTDSGESQDASHSIAFPIWGFGAGLRVTFRPTERFAFFVQGQGGAIEAYVPHGALEVLGYRNAESLGGQVGGRAGLEWYMADRHIALVAQAGLRDAMPFARVIGGADLPLMWDAAVGLRYTF
jgi:hypothetical protein